jgi:hypothetical protein
MLCNSVVAAVATEVDDAEADVVGGLIILIQVDLRHLFFCLFLFRVSHYQLLG